MTPHYVQFLIKDLDGNIAETLGSDGVHSLDKRLTLDNKVLKAEEQKERLKSVRPNYIGFRIYYGNLLVHESLDK